LKDCVLSLDSLLYVQGKAIDGGVVIDQAQSAHAGFLPGRDDVANSIAKMASLMPDKYRPARQSARDSY